MLNSFGSYGFPESHAVSFALLVYVSSWLKCYYPDVFAYALLNSMPMGFYQPAQIVIDAKNHDVEIRPVDINYSLWDNQLEERYGKYCVLRLGFRQVKGLREEEKQLLISKQKNIYSSINELKETGISQSSLEMLANADAFRSIGLDRREALWEVSEKDKPIGIYTKLKDHDLAEKNILLPAMELSEHVVHDYATTSLSLKAHPVSFVREKLDQLHVVATKQLSLLKNGDDVKVAGLVSVKQRPGTAKGVCFMTIEDETGCANVVFFQNLFEKFRKEIVQSKLIMVEGKLQIEGEVIHVIVECCYDVSKLLRHLTISKNKVSSLLKENNQEEIFSGGRNFR